MDTLLEIEKCMSDVILDTFTEGLSPVDIDMAELEEIVRSNEFLACTCSSSCGSNYSRNGSCPCASSCGSNYSR